MKTVVKYFCDEKRLSLMIGSFFLLNACASIDVAAIRRPGFVPDADESRLYKRADEFSEMLEESGHLYPDQELEVYLNDLARKLLSSVQLEGAVPISIRVINDPSLNAFALPNGRIFVHTGILAVAENEAQVAALLSHEMTHVLNRHLLKQFRSVINKTAFWGALQMPLAVAGGVAGGAVGGNLASILGQVSMVSSIYGFSRELETEADTEGFAMMTAAGYAVSEAPKLFQRLGEFIEDEDVKQPFFFSTHPQVNARIENFKQLIQEKGGSDQTGIVNAGAYKALTGKLVLDNFYLALQMGMFKTAQKNIDLFIDENPQNAAAYYARGELYRQRQDPLQKKEKKRDKTADYDLALAAYATALKLDPGIALAIQGEAKIWEKQGDLSKAREAYRQYLTLNPQASDREYVEQFLANSP